MIEVIRRSVVAARPDEVWERVVTPEGINDELMPYMRMMLPRRHRGITVADVTPGTSLGRVWIFYLGVLPLDWDRMTIAELEPGRGFVEVSSMASMRIWRHERTLTERGTDGTEVIDRLRFTPRLLLRPASPLLEWFIGHLFEHRHRRLAKYFS
ncbi:hypothetical protein AAFP35_24205 [Gordonia sp. CPCC 206044]|uniref:hypothetical protein n=1 Tax=Gordonia sp. CPCC 206044 TaxID=3140793 RepID=UPI003AF3EA0B